jgi:hypothetical protein
MSGECNICGVWGCDYVHSDLIAIEDQAEILICAFRYALGRRTYITSTVSDVIRGAWPHLSPGDRALIQREIRQAIDQGRAGMECDIKSWQKVLELEL